MSAARRSTRARSALSRGLMSDTGTRDVVAAAGSMPIHPHFTPWFSARRKMPWMRRTVSGANAEPPDPPKARSRALRTRIAQWSSDQFPVARAGRTQRRLRGTPLFVRCPGAACASLRGCPSGVVVTVVQV